MALGKNVMLVWPQQTLMVCMAPLAGMSEMVQCSGCWKSAPGQQNGSRHIPRH